MSASRSAIVHEIEDAGVIAVIRLSNGGQLRAVADALIEGGVRALEVTMTVDGQAANVVRIRT